MFLYTNMWLLYLVLVHKIEIINLENRKKYNALYEYTSCEIPTQQLL